MDLHFAHNNKDWNCIDMVYTCNTFKYHQKLYNIWCMTIEIKIYHRERSKFHLFSDNSVLWIMLYSKEGVLLRNNPILIFLVFVLIRVSIYLSFFSNNLLLFKMISFIFFLFFCPFDFSLMVRNYWRFPLNEIIIFLI